MLISAINACVTFLFDALLWPIAVFDPRWAMAAVSLATGVVMLWIFGKVSNQAAIRRTKERIRGNLIGVRLFQRDLGVVLRLQRRILRDTLVYMGHSLAPMLVMIVPVALILIQLSVRMDRRPLRPGETAVVKARMRDGAGFPRDLALESSAYAAVETLPVRDASNREAVWRIRALEPGAGALTLRAEAREIAKRVVVDERWGRLSAVRTGAGAMAQLLHPGEQPIDAASPVQSIEIVYPSLSLTLFGRPIHWLVWFFVLSIVFGFALKGFLGVEI
ncbi:MAG: hypothetical protein NTW86_26480 [Candidatus Sumerlaeota bacterium]|nr:hypothetical protein [Candidatus Sumerlaeota bacterium]